MGSRTVSKDETLSCRRRRRLLHLAPAGRTQVCGRVCRRQPRDKRRTDRERGYCTVMSGCQVSLRTPVVAQLENTLKYKIPRNWGACVVQLVPRQTLGFGSGHDLRLVGSSPAARSESARVSLSLSPPPPLTCSQINK